MACVLFADGIASMNEQRYREAGIAFRDAYRIYKVICDAEPTLMNKACMLTALTQEGVCLASDKFYKEALDIFLRVLRIASSNEPAYREDEEAMITVRKYIGSCYAEMKDWENAIKEFDCIIDILREAQTEKAVMHLREVERYLKSCIQKATCV